MSCIDTNLKEFRSTANKLNIHPDNLETVLYKLVNVDGKETPSGQEIMEELMAKPFNATENEVRYFSRMGLGKPRAFGNLKEANEYASNINALLGNNTSIYRNSRGEYVVSVGTPVIYGLPFAIDGTTIDKVLDSIDGSSPYHHVLQSIVNTIGKENITVEMGELNIEDTTMKGKGYENPIAVFSGNKVVFDPINLKKYLDQRFPPDDMIHRGQEFRRLLAHELVHQMTYNILRSPVENLKPEEAKFKNDIERLYKEALSSIDREKYKFYGLEDVYEFISEALTNRDFQRHLATIKSSSKSGSLWSRIIDVFSKVLKSLSKGENNSILANIMASTSEFMGYIESSRDAMNEKDMVTPPEDLFVPSSQHYLNLASQLYDKADGYRDGKYSFEKRVWSKGPYMVLNIPTYRTSLEEAINKGYEMLRKLKLSNLDYIIVPTLKERDGRQYLNVKPRNGVERAQIIAEMQKEALEEQKVKDTYEEYKLEQLNDRLKALENLSQEERDFIARIEETNPVLAQQLIDGIITREQAWDIYRNGEANFFMPNEDEFVRANYAKGIGKETHLDVKKSYFDEAGRTTASSALETIISTSNESYLVELAKIVKRYLHDDVEILSWGKAARVSVMGKYTWQNQIVVYDVAARGDTASEARGAMNRLLLHEITHAITSNYLKTHYKEAEKIDSIIKELSDYIKKSGIHTFVYALKNNREFVAEFMSSPELREILKRIPAKQNLFQKMFNIIKRALGIKSDTSLFSKADKLISKLLDNVSRDNNRLKAEFEEDLSEEGPSDNTQFTLEDFSVKVPDGRDVSGGTIGTANGKDVVFNTIEGALQAAKLTYQDNVSYTTSEIEKLKKEGRDGESILERLGRAKTTQEAIDIANEVGLDKGLNTEAWESAAPIIRKALEDMYGRPTLSPKDSLKSFVNHSGGAVGSDSYWSEAGERYGVTSKHYHAEGAKTPKGNTPVSKEELQEADEHLRKANETLKRRFPTSNEYVDNLLRRNWQQVKNADEVFAVSTIKDGLVEGGTGWAVQMAIDLGKPVHVFDQNKGKWYTYENNTWVETGTPTLTENFAGIGTRNINEAGKKAIEEVYEYTKSSLDTQKETSNTTPEISNDRFYEGNITPDENTIFVFGSNPEGRHGAGAAKVAKEQFGAEYGVGEGLTGDAYALPTKDLRVTGTPKFKGKMTFSYGNRRASGVKATTTLDAIKSGERTATTRYASDGNISYWQQAKVGDIIEFTGQDGQKVLVRVTKELHQLPKSTTAEEWSAKEGWSTEHFNEKVKPLIEKGEAYQMEYEYIGTSGNLRSIPKSTIVDSIRKLYDTARRMPNKKFKVAYRNTDTASLNGYTGLEMIDMFKEAGPIPDNIIFSKEWIDTGKIGEEDFSKGSLSEDLESRILAFSSEFEGAVNSLVGIVPEPLLQKVMDYIMSDGQTELSETDAEQFLSYAEKDNTKQEATNQEQQSVKEENRTYMERAVIITQQIDNLNNSTILSATEVRHIAEQAVYWISDHITEIQETPGLAEKIYGEKFKDKDFASMSRAEVVKTIGPDSIIAMCKAKFSPENTDYEDFDTIEKAEVITDNWNAVMMLASDVFLSVEDFSIVSSKDGKTSEVNTDLVADVDNFNSSNMENDVLENEGDLQEHWQVETKTLDVLATMSQMVKQALTKCYLLDKDGNNITSEFGINERVNAREATNSILRWVQGALTLEQMIIKLQEKSDSNPWVRQIISRLSDTSGKEVDFQGQFFGTFCKHFQPYSVVIEEGGKYKSIKVNESPALKQAVDGIEVQSKVGEHPIFNINGINKESLKELQEEYESLLEYKKKSYDFTNVEVKEKVSETLGYISNLLGYYVTPEIVMSNLTRDTFTTMMEALSYITKTLDSNKDDSLYNPFDFKKGIKGNLRVFLKPITDHLEDVAVSAFYDSGKMYQSYITPSYTSKLFQKFGQTGKAFDDFIMEEYGDVPWFHTGTSIERGWRNAWLKALATDSKAREVFKHKVQLNFNKHNYMRNMSDMEYTLSILTEFFSESTSEKQTKVPAWFRIPMLSNKPSSEFIRFYSERGTNYRETLTNGFKMIFDQELSRIQTVEMRNLPKGDPRAIKNFETNGKKFMFLDFMNEYLTGSKKSSELGKLIRQKLDGNQVDEARLNELAKKAIMETMEARAESIVAEWEKQGILKGAEKIANIGTTKEEIRENLKNFVWNDTFAAMNIMQLTITDIAFYKDAEDLQKRLAQIHAPGIRGNVRATDYEGNAVTDGKFRTIKLTDFDTFVSNIIYNVSVVFDRKIASAPESEKAALRALKDSLVGENGAFRQINVADAQGYSCPTSYRKKAFVFGKWSRQAEEIYKKLKEGTYTYSDLKIAFQPLKPFVYSQILKDVGVEGAPLSKLKVPVQYKNSEYLLIMADALLQGENTGKPNLLRAIYEVMEESHYDSKGNYKTDGIDTVQFESTVKSGLAGKINLNELVNDPNGESIAKARMEAAIYEATPREVIETNPETGVEETRTIYERTGQYNNTTVDAVPFEDYCLQQEVPEHFKEHEQAHGSQLRYIIVSELENFNYLGEPVTYNLEGKQVTAQEFKAEYENTIAENIQESIDELAEELSLNDLGSIKDRNIALSKILQREILSSPRYGIDLLQACSVDKNGRFRIPLGDPIQSKRVEQLINSIIKNRINKQKIAGGPVVQVTNFGTSKELNIRFKDKSGNLLMTRAEYERNPIKKEMSQTDKFNARYKRGTQTSGETMSYEDYIRENQAGIAYFEVFAPIYSNQLFTQFADKNGIINIQALEMLDPDLLKMIGYRIPTEDKYSMAPLKIVGFLPREAGDGIMLPSDITLLTGSDFDVDKEYLMRKEYSITKNKVSRSEIHRVLYDELVSSQKGKLSYSTKVQLNELIDQFLDDPFDSSSLVNQRTAKGFMTMTRGAYNKMLRTYIQNMYTVNRPTEGRTYRNNKIVDMTYEVLTHETSADKMLNPGGFDQQKKMGYMVNAYKLHSGQYTWEQLQDMSISELKDLSNSSKNLSYIDTHIQFYKQNSAAGSLIGIFAVNRIAHAVLESGSADGSSTYSMNVDNVCKLTRHFRVAGMEFGGIMPFDMRYDRNGQLIGKVMGSLVASAADAVKDPILNLMNINSNTANILNTLVRFGMPFENAALFLSQSVISEVLADFSRENISGYTSLSKVIQNKLNKIKEDTGIDEYSDINKEELTYEELVEGLKPDAKPEIVYKTLIAFSNFQKMAEALRMPTFATRFNSISSSVGPLIIDNLITEQKMQKLSLESNIVDANFDPVDMSSIFHNHPILYQFQRTVGIARQLFGNMPANSTGFRNILGLVGSSPLSSVIFGDRKLLSSLSDFYQSYLVMKGGVINPNELGSTITEFPKEFMAKEYKKKYADNALIQAIKYGTDKSGRATLQVDITGLDTQQKEKLSSAWIDLHKADPELSIKLFKYNFFRGGIGFSPKTFMSLVPVYVKERIPGYVDTFRVLPSTVPETVLDQFIRNNWDNNKLVPRKKVTLKELPNGHVEVFKPSEVKELSGIMYFKTKVNGKDKLFMSILESDSSIEFAEIAPLGSNKEYLEMSESTIDSPLNVPTEAKVETTEAEVGKQGELSETDTSSETEETDSTTTDDTRLSDLLHQILVIEGVRNEEQAGEFIKNYKAKSEVEKAKMEKHMKKFFETRFKKLGIEFNEKLIGDIYKLMC